MGNFEKERTKNLSNAFKCIKRSDWTQATDYLNRANVNCIDSTKMRLFILWKVSSEDGIIKKMKENLTGIVKKRFSIRFSSLVEEECDRIDASIQIINDGNQTDSNLQYLYTTFIEMSSMYNQEQDNFENEVNEIKQLVGTLEGRLKGDLYQFGEEIEQTMEGLSLDDLRMVLFQAYYARVKISINKKYRARKEIRFLKKFFDSQGDSMLIEESPYVSDLKNRYIHRRPFREVFWENMLRPLKVLGAVIMCGIGLCFTGIGLLIIMAIPVVATVVGALSVGGSVIWSFVEICKCFSSGRRVILEAIRSYCK